MNDKKIIVIPKPIPTAEPSPPVIKETHRIVFSENKEEKE